MSRSNQSPASLQQAYADFFPVGAAVSPEVIESHGELLRRHFGSLTCENDLKFARTQPEEGTFTFERSDRIIAFAREHGMKVRGHTLVWHQALPDWPFVGGDGAPATRRSVLERLEEHIHTVLAHTRGDVYCWDVVNEAVDERNGGFLRDTPWLQAVGKDYLDMAFRFAHEADPDAALFYNDCHTDAPDRHALIMRLLRGMLDRGVPVHGMGMQAHSRIDNLDVARLRAAIEDFASLGLQVQITEFDLSLYRDVGGPEEALKAPPAGRLEEQARLYDELFAMLRDVSQLVTGFTFWGVADDRTWLDNFPVKGRKNWPLLFDERHEPKDAFRRVVEGA